MMTACIAPAGARPLLLAVAVTTACAWPSALAAQHTHDQTARADSAQVADVPPNSAEGGDQPDAEPLPMASGTSWLPRSARVRGAHGTAGKWMVMTHGTAFGYYTKQSSLRGGWQAGSINWAMVAAERSGSAGRLELRAMASADPYTVGDAGYPLLLQTGETYQGVPLHDRQHPHELVMELSTTYERRLVGPIGVSLYLAAVGEPAAGPVAFMHRPSAEGDPFSPLSHHWQDASHVTFGVITAGFFLRNVKVEASVFNGREPDEVRTNFDYAGRKLDSWSARLTVAPARNWALSAWYAYFETPNAFYPEDWAKRIGASMLHSRSVGDEGSLSSALIWGASRHEPSAHHPVTRFTHSVTAETSLEIGRRNTLYTRLEYVQKDVEELFVPHVREEIHNLKSIAAGYVREVARMGSATLGLGVRGNINFIPPRLAYYYGEGNPRGGAVYTRLTFNRPARQSPHAGH